MWARYGMVGGDRQDGFEGRVGAIEGERSGRGLMGE